MKKATLLMISAGIATGMISCQSDEPDNAAPSPFTSIEMPESTRGISDNGNDFAIDLFSKVANADEGENIVISPYSAFNVLAMLANGDDSETRDEVLERLGFGKNESGLLGLNDYCRTLNSALPTLDNRTRLAVANSIWGEISPLASFADAAKNTFNTHFINQNPAGDSGKDAINKWVSSNTENMIPEFIQNPLFTELAIINATYFNGEWQKKFDKSNTAQGQFLCHDYTWTTKDFMNLSDTFYAYSDEKIDMVELPYGSGNFSMILAKPSKDENMAGLLEYLESKTVNSIFSELEKTNVELSVPKFSSRTRSDLLTYLGLEKARSTGFNSIVDSRDNFLLTAIIQETVITVDENGTESASVSMAGMVTSPMYTEMKFDSPFIYMIRETSTNTILFIGQVLK
ncbi:MAG: hypothetical protein K2I45_08715 [Muribaculaceae bacterium]|nr:hypothetical protein [Muribaculaceae bacterium]